MCMLQVEYTYDDTFKRLNLPAPEVHVLHFSDEAPLSIDFKYKVCGACVWGPL